MAGDSEIKAGGAFVELGTKDSKLVAGLAAASQKLNRFAENAERIGRRMMGVGLAAIAPLALAVNEQAKFGQQMAKVSTMLSDADMQFMPVFKKSVSDFAVRFGEDTGTIANGLYDILSAGVPAAGALGVLEEAMKAAAAGASDTGTAADALTTVLNSYRLGADQAASVSDWLFAVVKKGKTDFSTLAPTIGMVASTASSAGLSLEELGATISTMTRNGVKTAQAVASVSGILMNFMKPTDEASEAAKKFGVEMNTTTLKTLGLSGVLKRLKEGGATAEDLAKIFPNVEALRGVNPLMGDLVGLEQDLALMGNRAGLTQEAFAKQTDTLAFQIAQLKQGFLALLRSVGAALEPLASKWASKILEMVRVGALWIEQNKGLVISYAKMAITVTAVGAGIFALGLAVKAFAIALAAVTAAPLVAIAVAAVMVLSSFEMIDRGWGELLKSIRIGGASIGAYMQTTFLAILSGWDWVMQGIDSFWDAVITSGEGAADAVKNAFWDALATIRDSVKSIYITVRDAKNWWSKDDAGYLRAKNDVRKKAEELFGSGALGGTEEERAKKAADREAAYTERKARRKTEGENYRNSLEQEMASVFAKDTGKPGISEKIPEFISSLKDKLTPEMYKQLAAQLEGSNLNLAGLDENGMPNIDTGMPNLGGGTKGTDNTTIRGSFSASSLAIGSENKTLKDQLAENKKANKHLAELVRNTSERQVAVAT
jgi:TP901 family phage tail tape measure protein